MFSAESKEKDPFQVVKAHMDGQLKALMGLEDTSGVALLGMVRGLSRLCEGVESQRPCDCDLSGPRWGVLLRLMAEERLGEQAGMTPTGLSHFQGVSKNTISSLLRGLEEQGYIQRALDPDDYRVFRIQLTQAGRELIELSAPERFRYVNRLAAGLSSEEREQLTALLEKLYRSVLENSDLSTNQSHDA